MLQHMVATAATSRPGPLTRVPLTVYTQANDGRLAQRESAPFTRERPLVQSQHRPPPTFLDRRTHSAQANKRSSAAFENETRKRPLLPNSCERKVSPTAPATALRAVVRQETGCKLSRQ
jgi:hypothetical protein